MGLVGQLLQRNTTSCSSVDTAVAMAAANPIPEEALAGAHTAEYLFCFGATCLERYDNFLSFFGGGGGGGEGGREGERYDITDYKTSWGKGGYIG